MTVVMILAAVIILVGVFFVATGRGGELAYEYPDYPPLDLGPVSATDVALLRPPTALWGYNMQVTDEALERISQAVRDRDVTIAFLQQRLADQATQTAPNLPLARPPGPVYPADPAGGHEGRPSAQPPGDGTPAEPGDGTLAQPGDGTLAEPGDGTLAEPGDGTLAEPGDGTLAEPGDGTLAEPGDGRLAEPGDGRLAEPGDGTLAQSGDGRLAQSGDGTLAEPGDGTLATEEPTR